MKYCLKCGMLLEDTIDTCIRCGTDVSVPENISYFPPEVQDSVNRQRMQNKNSRKTVILIICIIIALFAIVATVGIAMSTGKFMVTPEDIIGDTETESQPLSDSSDDIEAAGDVTSDDNTANADETQNSEEVVLDETVAEAEEAVRPVKDSKGRYFNYISETDDVGNVVLNAVYPEDFVVDGFQISYDKYSNRFPINMVLSTSGEDNGVHFFYMSPQHFWHKEAKKGKSYADNRSAEAYMTYYKYDGAKGYIEAELKASYPNCKLELLNEEEVSADETEKLKEFSEARKKDITLKTKYSDYAHIGKDTEYIINQETECSASIYEYKVTTADKMEIFEKFYVPVIANKMEYANALYNEMGVMTEWYMLAFIVMEAGNQDLYDDYSEDFNIFIENCIPTDTFMKINQQYSDEINEYVAAKRTVEPITAKELTNYGENTECKLYDFYAYVQNSLRFSSGGYFANDDFSIYVPDGIKVGFGSEEIGKVFISTVEDEYPGDKYTEMTDTAKPVTAGVAEEVNGEDEDSADEDDSSDTESSSSNKKRPGNL